MGQYTAARLRMFGVVASRWALSYLSTVLSTYTQASPMPGTARTDSNLAQLNPQVHGAQSQIVELPVVQSGSPKLGGSGLQVGFRGSGEGDATIRGFTTPSYIADSRMWGVGDTIHTYCNRDTQVDAALFPLSGRVACWSGRSSGGNSDSFAVFNPHTEQFENAQTMAFSNPTFVVIPGTERVLALCSDATRYSDDYGASWITGTTTGWGDAASPALTLGNPGRVRSAYDSVGNVIVVAQDSSAQPKTVFFASSDHGASWTEVVRINPTGTARLRWDIVAHPDGVIVYAYYDPNAAGLFVKRLGSAYQDPTQLDTTGEIGSGLTPQMVHLACDSNGVLWAYVQGPYATITDPNATATYYSTDGGATWSVDFDVFVAPYTPYSAEGWLSARMVPSHMGGLFGPVTTGYDDDTTMTGENRTACARLGGWRGPGATGMNEWTGTAWTWWAIQGDPAKGGMYTNTTSGGSSAVTFIDGGYLGVDPNGPWGYWRIDSGVFVPGTYYYDSGTTLGTTDTREISCRILTRVESDGGGTADAVVNTLAIRLQTFSAAANAQTSFSLRMDQGGYRIWDNLATAWLGPKVALDLTVRTWIEVSLGDDGATLVTRHMTETPYAAGSQAPADRTLWTETTWTAPSTSATVSGGATIRWGVINAAAGAAISFWTVQAKPSGAETVSGFDMTGIGIGSYRYPIPYAHDPIRERLSWLTLQGLGMAQEVYTVEPRYGYPIRAVFPTEEPSPDVTWRSTATGSTVRVVVNTNDDPTTRGSHLEGELALGIVVRNANFRKVDLIGYDPGSIVATVIDTLDLAHGFAETEAIEYTWADGTDWIMPTGSGVGGRRIRNGEFRGGMAILDPAGVDGTFPGPHYIRIKDNSPGWWDASKGLRARVYLEGMASEGYPTSGAVVLCAPGGCLVSVRAADAADVFAFIGYRINSTEGTPDDYVEAGTIALVSVIVPGKGWANGSGWTLTPNVDAVTDEYGTERVRQKGPNARTWEVSYDHGAKMDRVRAGDEWVGPPVSPEDRDYALAGRDEVFWQLWDVFETAKGGQQPVLVIAADPPASGSLTLTDASLWLFGVLKGELRVVTAWGDEGEDEFQQGGSVMVSELV